MAILQKINSKVNIRKTSEGDVPYQSSFPVIAKYEATSTAAQTVINMSFSVDQNNKEAFQLFVDGKLLREGASNDYLFTSVLLDNTSYQVTLNYQLSSNLNIIAIKLGVKKETEFNMDNRFVSIYERLNGVYNAVVGNSYQLSQGIAQYTSLQQAINSLPSGGSILVLGTYAGGETITISSSNICIEGKGNLTNITGNLILNSGATGNKIEKLRITGNVTINAGANYNDLSVFWCSSSSVITDNGTSNYVLGIQG